MYMMLKKFTLASNCKFIAPKRLHNYRGYICRHRNDAITRRYCNLSRNRTQFAAFHVLNMAPKSTLIKSMTSPSQLHATPFDKQIRFLWTTQNLPFCPVVRKTAHGFNFFWKHFWLSFAFNSINMTDTMRHALVRIILTSFQKFFKIWLSPYQHTQASTVNTCRKIHNFLQKQCRKWCLPESPILQQRTVMGNM